MDLNIKRMVLMAMKIKKMMNLWVAVLLWGAMALAGGNVYAAQNEDTPETSLALSRENGDAGSDDKGSGALPEYTTFSELSGKRVALLTGAAYNNLVSAKVPDVAEFSYYNNIPDLIQALRSNKIDAFVNNNAVAQLAVNRYSDLALFPENIWESAFGIAFSKGDPRRDLWQATRDSLPEDEVEAVWKKWTGVDESVKRLPEQDWPGTKGTVYAAVCDTMEPMSYIGEGGEPLGFDVEMIMMIAKELQLHVEFTSMEFSALLAYVQSGKADIGAGGIIITEERADAVDFASYYPAAFVLNVRAIPAQGAAEEKSLWESFWDGVASSFQKTFLREDRWVLFLEGIGNTMLITVLSTLFGTALGFLVFMLCRNGNVVANGVTRSCIWLLKGMPMVVLLMILYYIIFGQAAISGITVAVMAFTLTFGASVYGLLQRSVGAIDRSQYEAAYALGHSNRHTFYKIILPQALPSALSVWQGEVVGLIKATAIVGYIAVQDLTKMGDIVRSRTYEAFFPLIAVTVIYFVLEALLALAVKSIRISVDPRKRSVDRILKGVTVRD